MLTTRYRIRYDTQYGRSFYWTGTAWDPMPELSALYADKPSAVEVARKTPPDAYFRDADRTDGLVLIEFVEALPTALDIKWKFTPDPEHAEVARSPEVSVRVDLASTGYELKIAKTSRNPEGLLDMYDLAKGGAK